jgi:hypothetical protein
LSQFYHDQPTFAGPMVRISPDEVVFADLAAFCIIHNGKDGSRKGDWYVKITAFLIDESLAGMFNMRDPKPHGERRRLFSQGFSKSTILNRKSQSKPEFVLQLLRSDEMFLLVPPTY